MTGMATLTAADLLARATGANPAQPLFTWYDDAIGERVELSGLTFGNWVAKTANLLVDGCGLGAGDTASVSLPPHWQTAAVLIGCWTAGLTVVTDGPADVAFASTGSASAATSAPDRYVLGLAPMGMPMRDAVPDGWLDYIAEVRGHGDRFTPMTPAGPGDPALDAESHTGLLGRAAARAADLRIPPDARVLIDAGVHPDPVDWLLAPLVSRTSVVLCANADRDLLEERARSERAEILLP
jgi:uncharacterized protein (TIGR03089 family)